MILSIVDKLTRPSHFIPIRSTHKNDEIANIFIREIFKLHGLPKAIVFNRYIKFTSNFLERYFQILRYPYKLQHFLPSTNKWVD